MRIAAGRGRDSSSPWVRSSRDGAARSRRWRGCPMRGGGSEQKVQGRGAAVVKPSDVGTTGGDARDEYTPRVFGPFDS